MSLLRSSTFLLVVGASLVVAPATSHGDEDDDRHPFFTRGFTVDLGVFYPDRDLNLRVRGTGDITEIIDFDETLNLSNADQVFSGELVWKFSDKWSLLTQYFKSSDSVRATLGRDVEWGDLVFGENTGVAAGTDFTLTRLFFSRRLTSPGKRHETGIGAGIHWLDIGAFIEGTVVVNGESVTRLGKVSASAPLPNLGVSYKYAIAPRWAFRSRLDYFSASIDDYDGYLINASVGVNYQFVEFAGIGVNYNYFELDARVSNDNWRGQVETAYDGAYVYLSAFF